MFQKSLHELQIVLHLFHLPQEFLRQFRVSLPILNSDSQVNSLELQLDDLLILRTAVLQQSLDITGLMLAVILQLPHTIIKGDHPPLHLAHSCLGKILELIYLLRLCVLPLDHQLHLSVQALLVLPRLLTPCQDLPVQTRLEVVQLSDLLLVHLNHCLHTLDTAIGIELRLLGGSNHRINALILELYVGGLARTLSLKQKIMVFDLLLKRSQGAFDLVKFDGLLGLLLVEGLQ